MNVNRKFTSLSQIILFGIILTSLTCLTNFPQKSYESSPLPPPKIDKSVLHTFNILGAKIHGGPIKSANDLPRSVIVTSEDEIKDQKGRQVTFSTPALFNTTAPEIFKKYDIPIYASPPRSRVTDTIYSPPTFVIKQYGHDNPKSDGFFTLTPILEKTYQNMTLLINDFPLMENQSTGVDKIKMTFAKDEIRVGLSIGASEGIPTEFNVTKPKAFNTTLFLNTGYIGNEASKFNSDKLNGLNLSSVNAFSPSPELTLKVSKSLNAEKLDDGCPKMKAGVFNDVTRKWSPLNVTRTATEDSGDRCGYQLLLGHFSKFAVGGVVPPNALQVS
jgi:hypothetical protein